MTLKALDALSDIGKQVPEGLQVFMIWQNSVGVKEERKKNTCTKTKQEVCDP